MMEQRGSPTSNNNANNNNTQSNSQSAGLSSSPDDDNRTEVASNTAHAITARSLTVGSFAEPEEWQDDDDAVTDPPFLADDSLTSHPNDAEEEAGFLLNHGKSIYDDDLDEDDLDSDAGVGPNQDSTAMLELYQDELDSENDPLRKHQDNSTTTSTSNNPTVYAAEDDYQDREQPEGSGGVRQYENVEYQKFMGRLVLSDSDLKFYRWEEAMVSTPWRNVAKIQVSPPNYKVPMMRMKTGDGQNYVFQLAHSQMAETLRDDLKGFPIPTAPPATAEDNRNSWISERDIHVAPVPYTREKATPLQDLEGSYKDVSDNFESGEMDILLNKSNSSNNNHNAAKNGSTDKIMGEDGEEEEVDVQDEENPRGGVKSSSSSPESLREFNERNAEKKDYERRLYCCVLLTCCLSAIVFLLIGGTSGYFIGKDQGSSSSNSDKNSLVATPVPSVSVAPSTINAAPSTGTGDVTPRPSSPPSISPSVSFEPTLLPSDYPTFNPENRTFQPTLRVLPPRTRGPVPVPTTTPSSDNDTVATLAPSIADETSTTEAPTSNTALLVLIRDRSSDNGTALDTQGTPQNRAYEWISLEDSFAEQLSEEKQLQRYSLGTFYYSTGGDPVWGDAAATARQAETTGPWLSSASDDCEWEYIVCNENQEIIALELFEPTAPDLRGILPAELGLLTSLIDFVISTGDAEEAAAARQATEEILLELDKLERQGDGNTTAVNITVDTEGVDNINNEMVSGPLPSELGLLTQLQTLMITDQALSGQIPGQVGSMASIVSFDVTNNQLGGPVPWQLGILSQIKELRLGFNRFQTTLKVKMFTQENGMAQSLNGFFVNNNQIRGNVPTEIGLLTSITTGLFLQANKLSSTLPSELGELRNMKVLRVDSNAMAGEIPSDFGKWGAIDKFQVQANGFTGAVPGDVCRLFLVRATESYADCDELECTCCQYCCINGACEEA